MSYQFWTEDERDTLIDFVTTAGRLQMTVALDSGDYCHLIFAQQDTSAYRFELLTAPGMVVYTAGHRDFRLVFNANLGMFRGPETATGARHHRINPDYWSQKLPANSLNQIQAFDKRRVDAAIEEIIEAYAEDQDDPIAAVAKLRRHVEYERSWNKLDWEEGVREFFSEWETEGITSDTFEIELHSYRQWYLRALHNIVHGVHMYCGDAIDYSGWDLLRGVAQRVGRTRRAAAQQDAAWRAEARAPRTTSATARHVRRPVTTVNVL